MEKFLFTDGTNGVKEVQSPDELKELIKATPNTDTIRIWLFNTNEWMSYAAFCKQFPFFSISKSPAARNGEHYVPATAIQVKPKPHNGWVKKGLIYAVIGTGIFLVYNFTRINWEKAGAITITAARPDNVPSMDVDSLIADIEFNRGQRIDKNTKNNLRLRNTWPEKILLQAVADHDVSSAGKKYYNIRISVDNTTGFTLDNATILFTVWKDNKASTRDTIQFQNITYSGMVNREIPGLYRGDSLSVAFESVKAKAFNFCYSVAKENSSGNYNDRWFCRE